MIPEPPVEPDPERPEPNDDEERGLESGGYSEWDGEPDYGGAFDGFAVTSDADPGL